MTTQRTPAFEDVLEAAMDARVADVFVSLPGRVESYDPATQKASVKPLIKNRIVPSFENQEVLEVLPVINNVPVAHPRSGDFFMHLPIQPGDRVLLVFCQRSLELYKDSNGRDVDPSDVRTHDIADAVAYPGFYPFPDAIRDADRAPNHLVLGKDEGAQVHIKDDEVDLFEENASEPVALADKSDSRFSTIESKINEIIVAVNSNHPFAIPTPLIPGGSVAASKVRAT